MMRVAPSVIHPDLSGKTPSNINLFQMVLCLESTLFFSKKMSWALHTQDIVIQLLLKLASKCIKTRQGVDIAATAKGFWTNCAATAACDISAIACDLKAISSTCA